MTAAFNDKAFVRQHTHITKQHVEITEQHVASQGLDILPKPCHYNSPSDFRICENLRQSIFIQTGNRMQEIHNLSVHELKQWQEQKKEFILLDVRNQDEVDYVKLDNSQHIPMNLIPIRHNEIDDDKPLVIYCHHGVRSYNVAHFLIQAGFDDVYNLQGGIEAWAQEIEPGMKRY